MDPITTLVVSSAVGGAAGGFIKEISSNGVKWIIELVTAQSPEMQTAAKKNLENFVSHLAKRVERLEGEIPTEKAEIFKKALNHPSSALLIKTAMIDSATTDNDERHELLAELIAQRLTANADDMIALAGSAACSVVISLSSRQIKILAVLSTIKIIRPLQKNNISELSNAKKYINDWWEKNIDPLIKDGNVANATNLDFEHLAAMGCVRISIGTGDLAKIVSSGIVSPEPDFNEAEFIGQEWFDTLKKQWENFGHATPTSIGQLIGILHRDTKLKTRTQINW
jgi:hypothetical protein